MVTVTDFYPRENNLGKTFYVLQLSGGTEFVLSKETNKYYLSSKKATISTTFTEKQCQELLGTEFPGEIQRELCEPFSWFDSDGTEQTRDYRYVFIPSSLTSHETTVISTEEMSEI